MNLNEETSIKFWGEWDIPQASILRDAWFDAIAMNYKISENIRYMHGMSGKKFRYMLNKLVEFTPDARYLEIGSWAGSTACSAMYENKSKITCIENWEHFGGPRDQFIKNVNSSINPNIDLQLIEKDFREVDYTNIGKYNIFMYDGPHALEDQYDGIKLTQPALDNVFTLIVDDWNQEHDVRAGTFKAINELNLDILAAMEIITSSDAKISVSHERSDWHNGYFIAILKKHD